MTSVAKLHIGTPLAAALECASLGLRVFPVSPTNKRPLIKDQLVAASADEQQVRKWWQQSPRAMVGVATGVCGFR